MRSSALTKTPNLQQPAKQSYQQEAADTNVYHPNWKEDLFNAIVSLGGSKTGGVSNLSQISKLRKAGLIDVYCASKGAHTVTMPTARVFFPWHYMVGLPPSEYSKTYKDLGISSYKEIKDLQGGSESLSLLPTEEPTEFVTKTRSTINSVVVGALSFLAGYAASRYIFNKPKQ